MPNKIFSKIKNLFDSKRKDTVKKDNYKIEITDNTVLKEPPEKINLQEIRQKLAMESAYKSKYEPNFLLIQNNSICYICCFLDKTLFITDDKLKPLLMYESTSYIAACGISNSGKYIACQTAPNKEDDNDSNVIILFDVVTRQEIARRKNIDKNPNDTRLIFIDKYKKLVFLYIADTALGEDNNLVVKFDFNLFTDEDLLRDFYKKTDISPYILNDRAKKLIDRLQISIQEKDEKELIELLDRLKLCDKISPYQLSLTYKAMGAMYEKHSILDKAILAYET